MTVRNPDYERIGRVVEEVATRRWCTIPQAAAILKIHPQTVRLYVKKGWLMTFQMGARPVIGLDELARFQRQGNREPDPDYQYNQGEEG